MNLIRLLIVLALSVSTFAQSRGVPVQSGTVANIPATCSIGEWYWATDATAGSNLSGGVTPALTNYALLVKADGSDVRISSTSQIRLDISNNQPDEMNISTTGVTFNHKITGYNAIATVSNGIPSELATIDLTGQTAAKGSTTLYTPTATGWFRFQYVAKVTTVATVSSILGGTAGLVLSYTDGTDSVAVTMACSETDQAGTPLSIATGNTLNTTAAMIYGSCMIYAKTGVAINYTFGYSSTNAGEMIYALRGKLEAM